MRNLALLVALLLAGVCSAPNASWAQTWTTYTSEAGGYRVDMPGVAKEMGLQSNFIPGSPTIWYRAGVVAGPMSYSVVYTDYPLGSFGNVPEEKRLPVHPATLPGQKLIREAPVTIAGHAGREYVIANKDDTIRVVRMTVVGTRVYQMQFDTAGQTEPTSPDLQRFLDSFTLLPTQSTAPAPRWFTYRSEAGHFRVDMPATPTLTAPLVTLPDRNLTPSNTATVRVGPVTYAVAYSDPPAGSVVGMTPELALEQMRDSPAKGHVLVSDEPITINGNPGREYVIVRADNYTFVVRTTLVGHRFYQLIFKARGLVEPDSPDVKRFLDSFALDQAPWDRTR